MGPANECKGSFCYPCFLVFCSLSFLRATTNCVSSCSKRPTRFLVVNSGLPASFFSDQHHCFEVTDPKNILHATFNHLSQCSKALIVSSYSGSYKLRYDVAQDECVHSVQCAAVWTDQRLYVSKSSITCDKAVNFPLDP